MNNQQNHNQNPSQNVQNNLRTDDKVNIQVSFQATPNPATLRFQVSQPIATKSFDFTNATEAQRSPLAAKIFGFPWTSAVFIGTDFVTVTKQDWVDWDILAEPLCGLIREHLERGEAVEAVIVEQQATDILETDSEVVKKIKLVLNNDIRPIVAMDGGDIVFSSFTHGVLAIHMKGACSGCPSSTATLKEGIEVRMRELIPEVLEVVSV